MKNIIISHKEDIDGLASAAFIVSYLKKDFNCKRIEIKLFDYNQFPEYLGTLNKGDFSNLFILDLGLNDSSAKKIIDWPINKNKTATYRRNYIDHHQFPEHLFDNIDSIKSRFNKFINPCGLNKPIGELCTASIIYDEYFGRDTDHFNEILILALISDNQKLYHSSESNMKKFASKFNKYISYYQDNNKKLLSCIHKMTCPLGWDELKKDIVESSGKVEFWFSNQYISIKNNRVESSGRKKILASAGRIKSDDITRLLQEEFPGYDIYVGLSTLNNYANIRTNMPIANIIAESFNGGGHPRRGGFKIPPNFLQGDPQKVDSKSFLKSFLTSFENRLKLLLVD